MDVEAVGNHIYVNQRETQMANRLDELEKRLNEIEWKIWSVQKTIEKFHSLAQDKKAD